MAEQYRFFGSAVGDTREYSQVEFAEVFGTIIGNGYLGQVEDELVTTENTPVGMSVLVGTGQAWINGYWYSNETPKQIPIATADASNPRIDRVVLRLDTLNARSIVAVVKTGTPASTPVAPSLTQTEQMWEIPLYQVYVAPAVLAIYDEDLTDERYQALLQDTDEILEIIDTKATMLETTETITVGTGGQFATINQALAYATKKYPTYVSASTRPRITISLLSGFVMAEQVLVDGIDLSWITISSVDAEVVIQRSALTTANAYSNYPAFTAQNGAFLPIINVLFNMDTSGSASNRYGIMASNNSKAIINSGKGVKNAGSNGIVANQSSTINANGAIASGAGTYGIYAENASTINANSANVSYANYGGVYATNASTIEFSNGNAQRAGYNTSDVLVNANADGIYANASSTINADSANASYSARYGVYARRNSRINFRSGIATNTGSFSVNAQGNSTVYAGSSNCSTDGSPAEEYIISQNSFIDITEATGEVNTSPALNSYTPAGLIINNTGVITTSGNATTTTYTATIPYTSWTGSSAPYSKAVTVSGILSTDTPIIDIVQTGTYATDQTMISNWGNIYRAVTSSNTITFYATAVPSADISIQVKVVR